MFTFVFWEEAHCNHWSSAADTFSTGPPKTQGRSDARAAWEGSFFHSAACDERTNKRCPTIGSQPQGSPLCRITVQAFPPQLGLHPRKQASTGLLPETLTWARPAGSPRPLVGIGLADGVDLQSIHANPGVEDLGGDSKDLTKDRVRGKREAGLRQRQTLVATHHRMKCLSDVSSHLSEPGTSRNFP